jgi:hypothetical protein
MIDDDSEGWFMGFASAGGAVWIFVQFDNGQHVKTKVGNISANL